MRNLHILAIILVLIGAVNWGLIGLFGFDLVAMIFGHMTILARIVYILVGLSGILLFTNIKMLMCLKMDCKKE